MNVIIFDAGADKYRAYDADLLAGIGGFDDAQTMLDACKKDESLLASSLRHCHFLDHETGSDGREILRARIVSMNHQILATPDDERQAQRLSSFEDSFRAGIGAVLLQMTKIPTLRRGLSQGALALAAAVSVSLASAPLNPAQAIDLSRLGKDGLGAVIGGALGNQIGNGRGRKLATVAGAILGVATAEALQQKNNPGNQAPPRPTLASGGQMLPETQRDKLLDLEVDFARSRDTFARSLLELEHADENLMLSPRDSSAMQSSERARAVATDYGRRYVESRNNFLNAVNYMNGRGYDMHDFSFSYSLAYGNVTAREATRGDLANSPNFVRTERKELVSEVHRP